MVLMSVPSGMPGSDRAKGNEARAVEEGCSVSDGFVKNDLMSDRPDNGIQCSRGVRARSVLLLP